MSLATVHVRPVKRCPKTGLLDTYQAWSGYCPNGPRSSWPIVIFCVALVAVAVRGMGL
jgi:hypothetical protein